MSDMPQSPAEMFEELQDNFQATYAEIQRLQSGEDTVPVIKNYILPLFQEVVINLNMVLQVMTAMEGNVHIAVATAQGAEGIAKGAEAMVEGGRVAALLDETMDSLKDFEAKLVSELGDDHKLVEAYMGLVGPLYEEVEEAEEGDAEEED